MANEAIQQDMWIETETRSHRVFMLWIDPKTGLTSKYDNASEFVGWSASKVKAYARKLGLSVVRKTVSVSRTPRSEILGLRQHAIGDLQVVETDSAHVLKFRKNGTKSFREIVTHEDGFLCYVLADRLIEAWNAKTEDKADDAIFMMEHLLETGGAKLGNLPLWIHWRQRSQQLHRDSKG